MDKLSSTFPSRFLLQEHLPEIALPLNSSYSTPSNIRSYFWHLIVAAQFSIINCGGGWICLTPLCLCLWLISDQGPNPQHGDVHLENTQIEDSVSHAIEEHVTVLKDAHMASTASTENREQSSMLTLTSMRL